MATKKITFKVKGTEMLQHNVRLANPMDVYVKAMKEISKKPTKTDEDYEEMARLEFMGGGYWDGKGYYIPASTWYAVAAKGATAVRLGTKFKETVIPTGSTYIKFTGPKDPEARWEGGFLDQRAVKVGRAMVMRTRPLFEDWSATVTFQYDAAIVDADQIEAALRTAGARFGIGDHRPLFGKFDVVEVIK